MDLPSTAIIEVSHPPDKSHQGVSDVQSVVKTASEAKLVTIKKWSNLMKSQNSVKLRVCH